MYYTVNTFVKKEKKQQHRNSALGVKLESVICFHLKHFESSTDSNSNHHKDRCSYAAAKWLLSGTVTASESKWYKWIDQNKHKSAEEKVENSLIEWEVDGEQQTEVQQK